MTCVRWASRCDPANGVQSDRSPNDDFVRYVGLLIETSRRAELWIADKPKAEFQQTSGWERAPGIEAKRAVATRGGAINRALDPPIERGAQQSGRDALPRRPPTLRGRLGACLLYAARLKQAEVLLLKIIFLLGMIRNVYFRTICTKGAMSPAIIHRAQNASISAD